MSATSMPPARRPVPLQPLSDACSMRPTTRCCVAAPIASTISPVPIGSGSRRPCSATASRASPSLTAPARRSPATYPHNVILQILAEFGIVGLLFFALFIAQGCAISASRDCSGIRSPSSSSWCSPPSSFRPWSLVTLHQELPLLLHRRPPRHAAASRGGGRGRRRRGRRRSVQRADGARTAPADRRPTMLQAVSGSR